MHAANDNHALLDSPNFLGMKLALQERVYDGYLGQYAEKIDEMLSGLGVSLQEASADYNRRMREGDTRCIDDYLALFKNNKSRFEGFRAICAVEARCDDYIEALLRHDIPRTNARDIIIAKDQLEKTRKALLEELPKHDMSEAHAAGIVRSFELTIARGEGCSRR